MDKKRQTGKTMNRFHSDRPKHRLDQRRIQFFNHKTREWTVLDVQEGREKIVKKPLPDVKIVKRVSCLE